MKADEFRVLAARIRPHTEYLYLHLMGEPLLHPELELILQIAGELAFRVIITTNGTLLPHKGELLLSAPAVYKANVSLQSFEANKQEGLEAYIRSCAEFAQRMSECGKLCVLRLWNRNGLEALNPDIERLLAESFPKPWTESRQSLRLCERVWLENGDRFDWPDMSERDRGANCFCYGLRDQIGVLCDGTVVPCCLDHEGDIALGNLFESELQDIMSTQRARAIYDGFSKRTAVEPLCQRCGYARRFT